ncbi:MAG: hypothetical protein LW832_09895 [Parachlamydia sp.]|jgi:hypothetical protein|nr:hypothetical protein [Parachlamydia sp.]
MKEQASTKDELFLLCLYEEALKQPNLDDPLDRYAVGKLAGLQSRGVNAICKLLLKANFIKKEGESGIYITPHGVKLAEKLHR